jgi:hypothetical protein
MAAVPEREAGIGSAVNDVSRQLGGALGVAVIGSVVSSAYRSNLRAHSPQGLSSVVAHESQRSIGVATQAARTLPTHAAIKLVNVADHAYVHAITRGFVVSIAVMVAALVVAAVLVPRRPRAVQATTDEIDADALTVDESPIMERA